MNHGLPLQFRRVLSAVYGIVSMTYFCGRGRLFLFLFQWRGECYDCAFKCLSSALILCQHMPLYICLSLCNGLHLPYFPNYRSTIWTDKFAFNFRGSVYIRVFDRIFLLEISPDSQSLGAFQCSMIICSISVTFNGRNF